MAKKDKFAKMQQGGGVGSFQETLVQAAATVAAIERQQEEANRQQMQQQLLSDTPASLSDDAARGNQGRPADSTAASTAVLHPDGEWQPMEQPRFMRLPNPQIPLNEYNLVSLYCSSLANMTRQDFVELAIVEKLHTLGRLADEEFAVRQTEIRNRPPRGQRKGTKQPSR